MATDTTEPENKGFFDTLGGLWGDFGTWAEKPENQPPPSEAESLLVVGIC